MPISAHIGTVPRALAVTNALELLTGFHRTVGCLYMLLAVSSLGDT